jgi:spermidine/putrescine ABC transporter ATP-binding subunit
MNAVEAINVSKQFGATNALDNVSIGFADGEMFCLLGPSGSGKTTLLRAIAGFVIPDAGTIQIRGQAVDNVPVHKRDIGMVFQSYALFPHLTVRDNIAFGLECRHVARIDADQRVAQMLDLVRLPGFGDRKPRQLSGGQQQRIALARALVTQPKVLLLDEPLGALDRRLRQEMQVELRQIQKRVGITAIFVTHDQEEALTLSDRIAILDQGKIIQVGPPQEVYERPKTVFAARFLGDANILTGDATSSDELRLRDGRRFSVPGLKPCDRATIAVRPEKLLVLPEGHQVADGIANRIEGTVMQSVYSGNSVTYRISAPAAGADPVLAFVQNQAGELLAPGSKVILAWRPEHSIPLES